MKFGSQQLNVSEVLRLLNTHTLTHKHWQPQCCVTWFVFVRSFLQIEASQSGALHMNFPGHCCCCLWCCFIESGDERGACIGLDPRKLSSLFTFGRQEAQSWAHKEFKDTTTSNVTIQFNPFCCDLEAANDDRAAANGEWGRWGKLTAGTATWLLELSCFQLTKLDPAKHWVCLLVG